MGTLSDGQRVYFDSPVLPWGSMAERTLIAAGSGYPLPEGLPDGLAVALGIAGLAAWLSLTWRAELQAGEHVLVLGASGIVGQVAVQAAKLLGASSVVAAARSQQGLERARARGAVRRCGPLTRARRRSRGPRPRARAPTHRRTATGSCRVAA